MTGLQPRAEQTFGAGHVRPSLFRGFLFASRAQVQMVLEQLSQQVTAPHLEEVRHLVAGQFTHGRQGQVRHERVE
ncbi:hypothetical protein [Streptomyces sp. HUAS TT7]|uniref:hypothetical protein n=1 Tax=Streptomyces sp. HUAS TT7 TaxID=3447507 RepID=UPI003F65F26E